jgi:hypothetical protein
MTPITITVPVDAIRDSLDRARISYWAGYVEQNHDDLTREGWAMTVEDSEGNDLSHVITLPDLRRAVQLMAEKHASSFRGLIDDEWRDETTGDILIQCACFGELRYG